MTYTIGFLLCLYNFCQDGELKRLAARFLDLFWLDWAVQSMGGLRGGPKVRHHRTVGGYDAMTEWARFYAGGSGKTTIHYAQQLIGDYKWPEAVWQLVLSPKPEEGYTYLARGVGEEEDTFPRPPGRERTMLGNCESRMVKVAWVTPDHILGTQMDHPHAIYNHLAVSGRWQGLVTDTTGFILRYRGLHPMAREIVFSGATPSDAILLDGQPIDYSPAKVFGCPYFESVYSSGQIKVTVGGRTQTWNFDQPPKSLSLSSSAKPVTCLTPQETL